LRDGNEYILLSFKVARISSEVITSEKTAMQKVYYIRRPNKRSPTHGYIPCGSTQVPASANSTLEIQVKSSISLTSQPFLFLAI